MTKSKATVAEKTEPKKSAKPKAAKVEAETPVVKKKEFKVRLKGTPTKDFVVRADSAEDAAKQTVEEHADSQTLHVQVWDKSGERVYIKAL